jgi:hypothetical protein
MTCNTRECSTASSILPCQEDAQHYEQCTWRVRAHLLIAQCAFQTLVAARLAYVHRQRYLSKSEAIARSVHK